MSFPDEQNENALNLVSRDEYISVSVDRHEITKSLIKGFIEEGGSPNMSIMAFMKALDE